MSGKEAKSWWRRFREKLFGSKVRVGPPPPKKRPRDQLYVHVTEEADYDNVVFLFKVDQGDDDETLN